MLSLRYPSALKRRLKATFRWQLRDALPDLIAPLMAVTHLIQHQPQADSYTLPAYPGPQTRHPSSYYPVPPMALWASYGTSPEEYLVTGQEDIEQMRAILTAAGHTLSLSQRVLEFGCAAGRLLLWLDDVAREGGGWGVCFER